MSKISDIKKVLEILIVDDDRIIRMLHRHTLERCNICHSIVAFANGEEAIDHIRKEQHPNKIFLVLLDINMPVMDGWKFLEESEKHFETKNVHTVMVSSSINIEDKLKAKAFPQVLGFFEKPFSPKSVAQLTNLQELEPFFLKCV